MKKHTIQIVCADLNLLRRYRVELERTGEPYRFRLAQSPDEARRSFLQVDPAVILLDESAVPASSKENALDAVWRRN